MDPSLSNVNPSSKEQLQDAAKELRQAAIENVKAGQDGNNQSSEIVERLETLEREVCKNNECVLEVKQEIQTLKDAIESRSKQQIVVSAMRHIQEHAWKGQQYGSLYGFPWKEFLIAYKRGAPSIILQLQYNNVDKEKLSRDLFGLIGEELEIEMDNGTGFLEIVFP